MLCVSKAGFEPAFVKRQEGPRRGKSPPLQRWFCGHLLLVLQYKINSSAKRPDKKNQDNIIWFKGNSKYQEKNCFAYAKRDLNLPL